MNVRNSENNVCPLCGGTRVIIHSTSDGILFENCKCVDEISWKHKLNVSNVPEKYRDFEFSRLSPEFVAENKEDLDVVVNYITNIDEYLSKGVGLFFQSDPGLAKSSLAALVVKAALKKGYECYMGRMSKFLTLKFDALSDSTARDLLTWIVRDTRLLVIEEIEKVYLANTDNAITEILIAEFFGELYDNKKSLILTSNLPRKDLKRIPYYLLDRFDEMLLDVIFVGESFRKR